ncbi:hypothetical protein [Pseudoruegeria sp. HB172150]|uniref:hypothetical protein n=1 Tax=Pseudoruegeria sp. HB172150 TaxID=2721164 RepID=UPI00155268B3|nr:hypothetical protein [Pseudoruegeria sp. HB172150]
MASGERSAQLNPLGAEFQAELGTISDMLNKESARGAVLVATGFVEQQLRDVLVAYLRPGKSSKELLDNHNAPLGSLHARIEACYALRLIDDAIHDQLQIQRKVRNEFAHMRDASFEKDRIKDLCDNTSHNIEMDLPRKEKFLMACAATMVLLEHIRMNAEQEPLKDISFIDRSTSD